MSLSLPEGARSRTLLILSGLLLAVALVQIGRLSVFMLDASRTGFSLFPSSEWETRHSCVSAYYLAGLFAGEGRNVYDESLYSLPSAPNELRRPRMMGAFRIDVYEYPPPFLLLPRALRLLAPEFLAFRFVWFVLNALIVLVAVVVVGRSMGEPVGTRALLLAPLVWAAVPMLSALQKGNIQLVVVALSMLAMLLLDRRHYASGGLVLAFATASKLYPGLLIVYLLVRRQWRALAWTAGWGAVLTLATLADVGWLQIRGFFEHLPGLLSGQAFPAFRNPAAMAMNFSLPSIGFKLKVLGIGDLSFGTAKVLGWIYTIVAVWATVALARRAHGHTEAPLAWLAIVAIATLRSPFLPAAYAAFPFIWLLSLLAATYAPTPRALAVTMLGWLAMNVYVPLDWMRPRPLALVGLIPHAVTIAVLVWAVRHVLASGREAERPAAAPPEAV
jgi:hypothetical protein